MGSGSGKPCHTRLEHPAAVERHCPVPKGLKLGLTFTLTSFGSRRKTLPCSKGIETFQSVFSSEYPLCRKTLPCSKGIETHFRYSSVQIVLLVERHCPVPKGLKHYANKSSTSSAPVERHCPVPKGLRLIRPRSGRCPRRKTLPCSKGIKIKFFTSILKLLLALAFLKISVKITALLSSLQGKQYVRYSQ